MKSDSGSQDQEQEERSNSDIQNHKDGRLHHDSNSRVTEDIEMHSNVDIEDDVPPSLFVSVSALEEEVTRTLLRMNGGNEAIESLQGKMLQCRHLEPEYPCQLRATKVILQLPNLKDLMLGLI